MPHYHKYEWEDFHIKAEPSGIRKFLKPLPYLTGSKPTFKVAIETTSGELRPLEMHIQLFDPTGKKESWKKLSWPDEPIKSIRRNLLTNPIAVSGDHYLQAHLIWHKPESPKSTLLDLVTFRAIAQETMLMWAIGILVVIGASIVHLLF